MEQLSKEDIRSMNLMMDAILKEDDLVWKLNQGLDGWRNNPHKNKYFKNQKWACKLKNME